MTRLIDAEALKEALNANCDTLCPDKNTNWCEHCCPHNDFEDLIDNAPTVEFSKEIHLKDLDEEDKKAFIKLLTDNPIIGKVVYPDVLQGWVYGEDMGGKQK